MSKKAIVMLCKASVHIYETEFKKLNTKKQETFLAGLRKRTAKTRRYLRSHLDKIAAITRVELGYIVHLKQLDRNITVEHMHKAVQEWAHEMARQQEARASHPERKQRRQRYINRSEERRFREQLRAA